jgi:hypothetical protein
MTEDERFSWAYRIEQATGYRVQVEPWDGAYSVGEVSLAEAKVVRAYLQAQGWRYIGNIGFRHPSVISLRMAPPA